MAPPLVLDIDGTLTRADERRRPPAIDPALMTPLRDWDAPLVIATGKSFPFPVALSQFMGREPLVVAETGGIALARGSIKRFVAPTCIEAVTEELRVNGYLDGTTFDDINYWRETELAVPRNAPLDTVRSIADAHGLTVLDSGYAYHLKDPSVSKGRALEWVAETLEIPLSSFIAVGDSANDVSMFERVGKSFALANADQDAKAAAKVVTSEGHASGTLEILTNMIDYEG